MTQQFFLPSQYLTAYFLPPKNTSFSANNDAMALMPSPSIFVKGKHFTLQGEECDDFTMPITEYELVGELKEVHGVELNSLIMKQISGEETTKFTLTKADCRTLNIPFERGLQLFPKTLNWKLVKTEQKEEKNKEKFEPSQEWPFDPTNLATYPVDYNTRTICCMMCKLHGFYINDGYVFTPFKTILPVDDFFNSIQFRTKNIILRNSSQPISSDAIIKSRFVFHDAENFYFELDFRAPNARAGVNRREFTDLELKDIVYVTWNQKTNPFPPIV